MPTKPITTIIFILSLFVTSTDTLAQQIRNSYLLYNQARVFQAQGKPDSAALLMLQSIRLNDQDMTVREYAWKTWLKTGRYNEWSHDLQRYYERNPMPETVDEVFKNYDSAVVAKAKVMSR